MQRAGRLWDASRVRGPCCMPPDADSAARLSKPSSLRLGVVLLVIAAAISALVGRVAWLQTTYAAQAAPRALRQQSARETLPARRGSVFDRNGLMLAGSIQLATAFADPKFMHEQFAAKGLSLHDMDLALARVADMLGVDSAKLTYAVGRDPQKRYVPLAHGLRDDVVEQLKALKVPGIGFEIEPERVYPMGQTAAHLLGTVGAEGKGLEGLEHVQDATLAGADGVKGTIRDKRRRPILAAAEDYRLPQHGEHLILTIDSNIQAIAEEELAARIKEFKASGGCVVVMDPNTGDILALANSPTYFPQHLADSTADARRNRAITDPFEPGSILKPFLLAGMIERGITRIDEPINVGPSKYYRPYPRRQIIDEYYYGDTLVVWDVIVKSSNIGMVKLGERTDPAVLTETLRSFGFGSKTGIGLGGEDRGLVPAKWGWGTRESIMQGYALLATPVQLCRAMAVLANGGRLVTPRLVAGSMQPGGEVMVDVSSGHDPQVIERQTAQQVRRLLADVAVRGTARRVQDEIERWNMFGKTGTAERAIKGRYNEEHYVSTFVGGAPYEAPRLVIAFSIYDADKSVGDTPGKGHHAGIVSAPAAARILNRAWITWMFPTAPIFPNRRRISPRSLSTTARRSRRDSRLAFCGLRRAVRCPRRERASHPRFLFSRRTSVRQVWLRPARPAARWHLPGVRNAGTERD